MKIQVTHGDVVLSWDSIRAVADVLIFKCIEDKRAPQTGGRARYDGSAGPSRGQPWPDNVVVTLARANRLGIGGNSTAELPGQIKLTSTS